MNTRVLILCAGPGERWGDHGGAPKHLTEVEGEILLHRTVRQVNAYTNDVCVISPPRDTRYNVEGAIRKAARHVPERGDADKYMSSRHLWNTKGRTVILLGDVWYTDEAMARIMRYRSVWTMYGRLGASQFTGYRYGECFAFSFHPKHHEEFDRALARAEAMKLAGRSGWILYKIMGMKQNPVNLWGKSVHTRRHVEINDWTDDFDYPAQLDRFLERRKAAECVASQSSSPIELTGGDDGTEH